MNELLSIRLFWAHSGRVESRWYGQNLRSTFWRLYWADGPGISVQSQNILYPIEPNRLFLIPPRCIFDILFEPQVPITYHFVVHFDVPGLPGFRLRTALGEPLQLSSDKSLETIAGKLTRKIGAEALRFSDVFTLQEQLSLQCLIFGALGTAWATLPAEKQQRGENFAATHGAILPALHHIENYPGSAMTNDQLADLCHLSRGHFIRLFGEATGRPPMAYLLEWRIALACQKLLFTSESIEAIAAELGFGNRFYFSRMFSRQVGLSPAAFRRDGLR